jgi:MYXO-CTERM domain-containing protein
VSGLIVAATTATAMADLNSVSWTVTTSTWGDTYQFFADVDAGDQLNAVYGDAENALSISTTGTFYQNAFGGPTVASMNPAFFPIFPSMVYDSFVTIGLETNVGNAMLDIGIDFTDFEAGGTIWTDNGSWFATPDDSQVHEIGGKVMFAQLTVAAGDTINGTVNMQGKNADGSNWTATAYAFSNGAIPAPGALALLGLAGVTARRRRK